MDIQFYFQDYNHQLARLSKEKWLEVSKLIPMMIDYINEAMPKDWRDAKGIEPASKSRISFTRMLTDRFDRGEVFVNDGQELSSVFAWAAFLLEADLVFRLYEPTVTTLRNATVGFDNTEGFDRT